VPASLPLPQNNDRFTWFLRLIAFVVVVAMLRVAEDVLMPIAFAILLAFLLSPLVVRLMRWGLPRTAAIGLTVTVAFGVIGATGWIVTAQALGLVRELPNYEENIRRKIVALKNPPTPSAVSRMTGMVENLRREIKSPRSDEPALPAAPGEEKPVPVEVKPSEPTPLEMATDFAPPVLRTLGTAAIVVVFVIAILFQREDLRDRLIRLLAVGRLNLASQALDDAAARVSRYLGMQLVVNATYGVPLAIGLHFIGIPNAPLWGLLATLLRFVPFVGPWIAAIFPVALAIAVDPGWTMFMYTIGLFIVLEVISNNVVEVLLYGATTGISSFALLVAAVFWTWLWGAPGLVLSTPLTVCVLVLGTYLPGLSVLSMLLGSQPALDPAAQFYQRMLALESEDMIDLAERHIREHSLEDFYERVFVPALLLAGDDRHGSAVPEVRQRFIHQAGRDLIEELVRRDPAGTGAVESAGAAATTTPTATVLLVPARDEADEIAALALRHLLWRQGTDAAVVPCGTTPSALIAAVRESSVRATLVSSLPPSAIGGARQALHRLRGSSPGKAHFAGVWQHGAPREDVVARLRGSEPSAVVTTFAEALTLFERPVESAGEVPVPPRDIVGWSSSAATDSEEKIAAK